MKMMGRGHLEANQMSISAFTDMLSQMVDRPVVDMTELKGVYDFKLDYTPEMGGAMQKMAMLAGPLFLVFGYLIIFWAARGLKAIVFLQRYKVPAPRPLAV